MSVHMHYTRSEHGTAVLDLRPYRGRWRTLSPLGAELWLQLQAGTPLNEAARHLAGRTAARSAVRAEDVVRDLTELGTALGEQGLLVPVKTPPERPAPRVCFAEPVRAPTAGLRLAAGLGLGTALVLLRCAPLRWSVAAARTAARLPGRPATVREASRVHAAVRSAARWWPGRSACLEESLATFLAASVTGRRVRWVVGAAFLPTAAHAWTEAEDTVIGQAEEERVWRYLPALEVERSN